jgi:hypothetical protein
MSTICNFPGGDSCKNFSLIATQVELDALPGIKVSFIIAICTSPITLWAVKNTAHNSNALFFELSGFVWLCYFSARRKLYSTNCSPRCSWFSSLSYGTTNLFISFILTFFCLKFRTPSCNIIIHCFTQTTKICFTQATKIHTNYKLSNYINNTVNWKNEQASVHFDSNLSLYPITFLPSSNLVFSWQTLDALTYSWPNYCSQYCYRSHSF